MTTDAITVSRVCALNDILRRTLSGGTLVLTAGIIALGRESQDAILTAVAAFDSFDADNDPHGEHDFGALTIAGERVYFKIDYYDRSLTYASPDPAETAMLAHVEQVAREEQLRHLSAVYIATERNTLCLDLYQNHGFRLSGEHWVKDLP